MLVVVLVASAFKLLGVPTQVVGVLLLAAAIAGAAALLRTRRSVAGDPGIIALSAPTAGSGAE